MRTNAKGPRDGRFHYQSLSDTRKPHCCQSPGVNVAMHAQWKCCEHFVGRHELEARQDHTRDETSAYRHITLSHDGIYEIYLRAFPIPYSD